MITWVTLIWPVCVWLWWNSATRVNFWLFYTPHLGNRPKRARIDHANQIIMHCGSRAVMVIKRLIYFRPLHLWTAVVGVFLNRNGHCFMIMFSLDILHFKTIQGYKLVLCYILSSWGYMSVCRKVKFPAEYKHIWKKHNLLNQIDQPIRNQLHCKLNCDVALQALWPNSLFLWSRPTKEEG
jgi:hypothetical protein